MVVERAPYGSWRSPITAASIVGGAATITEVVVDGTADDSPVWFNEARPAEGGRIAILRANADGTADEITPRDASVRTRVHEYGGGAFTVAGGLVVFSHDTDQRLYRIDAGGAPTPLTANDGMRYADARIDAPRGRLVAVREDHSGGGEAVNTLVSIELASGAVSGL